MREGNTDNYTVTYTIKNVGKGIIPYNMIYVQAQANTSNQTGHGFGGTLLNLPGKLAPGKTVVYSFTATYPYEFETVNATTFLGGNLTEQNLTNNDTDVPLCN